MFRCVVLRAGMLKRRASRVEAVEVRRMSYFRSPRGVWLQSVIWPNPGPLGPGRTPDSRTSKLDPLTRVDRLMMDRQNHEEEEKSGEE